MKVMDKLVIYSDGGARGNPGPAAAAFVVYKNSKIIYKDATYIGIKTNNQAEYFGVIAALSWLSKNKERVNAVTYYLDSELVVRQITGLYKVKSDLIKPMIEKVRALEKEVRIPIEYIHIKRHLNKIADSLVNKSLDENV